MLWQAVTYVPKEAEKPLRLWTFPGIKFIFPYSFAEYELFQKLFKIKVVKHSILYQKVSVRLCAHMSITPGRGARSLQRLAFSKYYNVQKKK